MSKTFVVGHVRTSAEMILDSECGCTSKCVCLVYKCKEVTLSYSISGPSSRLRNAEVNLFLENMCCSCGLKDAF